MLGVIQIVSSANSAEYDSTPPVVGVVTATPGVIDLSGGNQTIQVSAQITDAGVGSQHTPKDHVWPIAIAITALTSTQIEDRIKALDLLEATDAGTGFMHESFNINDDYIFTREWFSWSDMTYVDLVLSSVKYKF
jgi:hypothetical protein